MTKSCLTLCNPMESSTPGFSVPHYLLEFAQIHVHRVDDAIQPSHPLLLFSLTSIFPSIRIFPSELTLPLGGQSIGALASASVLSVNIQDWFSLGLASLISLLSKGLSIIFSSTTIWKHKFFGAQPSLGYFGGSEGKESSAIRETWVQSLGWEDPLEGGRATHSSTLVLENPHEQRSLMGYSTWVCRVGHDWATKHSSLLYGPTLTSIHGYLKSIGGV